MYNKILYFGVGVSVAMFLAFSPFAVFAHPQNAQTETERAEAEEKDAISETAEFMEEIEKDTGAMSFNPFEWFSNLFIKDHKSTDGSDEEFDRPSINNEDYFTVNVEGVGNVIVEFTEPSTLISVSGIDDLYDGTLISRDDLSDLLNGRSFTDEGLNTGDTIAINIDGIGDVDLRVVDVVADVNKADASKEGFIKRVLLAPFRFIAGLFGFDGDKDGEVEETETFVGKSPNESKSDEDKKEADTDVVATGKPPAIEPVDPEEVYDDVEGVGCEIAPSDVKGVISYPFTYEQVDKGHLLVKTVYTAYCGIDSREEFEKTARDYAQAINNRRAFGERRNDQCADVYIEQVEYGGVKVPGCSFMIHSQNTGVDEI